MFRCRMWKMYLVLVAVMFVCGRPVCAAEKVVSCELNGLGLAIERETGSLLKMAYPEIGTMLEAVSEQASVIDMAYPLESFQAFRLASRYSKGARIVQGKNGVRIEWEKLGGSREVPISGTVAGSVEFMATEDGRSVVMTAEIRNESDLPIRQILFPDFSGLIEFAGEAKTVLRVAGSGQRNPINPFKDLRTVPSSVQFYASDPNFAGQIYSVGNAYSQIWTRWIDFGGLCNGFCVFPEQWGWESESRIRLQRSELDGKVRLSYVHNVQVEPKQTWKSAEFRITPHTHGWAEGIEPYREFVTRNLKREYPLPRHIREGLGYRTIFMMNGGTPNTKEDIVYGYQDFPRVAREAKAHGLEELVPWFWTDSFQLPLTTMPILGSDQDLADAVAECKELGVNVSPFISIYVLANPTAARFGLKPIEGKGWTYHVDMIPMFNPPYASAQATAGIDPSNEGWQKEVFENWKKFIDMGVPSVVWDVYEGTRKEPNVYTLTSQIRKLARERDPESVFAGESLTSLEIESAYLDYTWNWLNYVDCRPYASVFPAPRVAVNIDSSPEIVKLCFADNVYMNVMPRKPGGINGSAAIEDYPEYSQALKQCAKLREQFLSYFIEGTLIGDCVLTEECPGTHVSAYVLADRVLVIVLNQKAEEPVKVQMDMEPWLKSTAGGVEMTRYNADGVQMSKRMFGGSKIEIEEDLKPLEMVVYEMISGK
ncbi:MAG TPA: hypothetical protein PLY86_07500 [bacterium]|nr:hypothetical protein [bacterium]